MPNMANKGKRKPRQIKAKTTIARQAKHQCPTKQIKTK